MFGTPKNILYRISFLLLALMLGRQQHSHAQSTGASVLYGANDSIPVEIIVFNGDSMVARTLTPFYTYSRISRASADAISRWTRLRNAVYVTYPYARRAGEVINDINRKLEGVTDGARRRAYIRSRESELRKEFTEPLTNLSVYQGKVLMKLINRQTGNNCYEIIKEYKNGLTARFYQTVAFFFGSSLKQPYDASGEDQEIERIVQEVNRLYGFKG